MAIRVKLLHKWDTYKYKVSDPILLVIKDLKCIVWHEADGQP